MKQDVKKDTLKAQLDDALRQSVDGTLLINPEMVVKQLEIIFGEQLLQEKKKIKELEKQVQQLVNALKLVIEINEVDKHPNNLKNHNG